MSKKKLDHMFNPSSLAVIGASKSPLKWGFIILQNIIEGGYEGKIYPVNPKEKDIQGLEVYPRVKEIPETVDVAIIVIPALKVPAVLEECVDAGVETAVVITAGFGETGKKGKENEKKLVSIAREGDLRFAGPNCMGIYSSSKSLHAMMPSVRPLKGDVSFVSQSGNLGTQMMDRGRYFGVGFDKFVSSGNEADLKVHDYIDYFRESSSTKTIISYVEEIRDGRNFYEVARRTTPEKPLVMFKVGETEAGKSAAKSHTGSLSGSKEVYDAVFKQTGTVKAESTDELLLAASAFGKSIPSNDRVAIVTRGGGWGVAAADACEKCGIKVPQPPEDILKKMDEFLPSYWSRGNPIDTVAEIDPSIQFKILDVLEQWDVGGIMILGGIGAYFAGAVQDRGGDDDLVDEVVGGYVRRIAELNEHKVVFGVAFKPMDRSKTVTFLRENGVPVYYSPEQAAESYSKLLQYKHYRDKQASQ